MMRQVVLAAVALLMACVASASHLETVFSVTMPNTETYGGDAFLFQDAVYVISGPFGGVLEAVNLTTRTNMWTSPNYTASDWGEIITVAVTSEAVLLSFGGGVIVALSSHSGQQLWSQSGYQLQQPAAFAYGGTVYAQVTIVPFGFDALQAFDLATGAPGYFQRGNNLKIDGNTAFVGQYSLQNGRVVNPYLRAIDIPTNTTLWMAPCSVQASQFIPAVSSEYVLVSNFSGSDEIAVVLHRKNGSVAQTFQAFNGFAYNGVTSLHGSMLFALVGLEFPRYVLADLTTGYITWTRSENEIGFYGAFTGNALVAFTQPLVLTITPIGNSPSISVPQVPSLPTPSVADFGYGVVQVGNLQGYTMWDTNTGDFLGSNEQDPNSGQLSAPLKWNGLSIFVSGNVVSAVQVVS